MGKIKNLDEWHRIGNKLTNFFGICHCQRKLKTIVDNLYSIYVKIDERTFDFTGAEWLIIALMDQQGDLISHGTNCEYPMLNREHEFWKWILKVKDNPALEDN